MAYLGRNLKQEKTFSKPYSKDLVNYIKSGNLQEAKYELRKDKALINQHGKVRFLSFLSLTFTRWVSHHFTGLSFTSI